MLLVGPVTYLSSLVVINVPKEHFIVPPIFLSLSSPVRFIIAILLPACPPLVVLLLLPRNRLVSNMSLWVHNFERT
ncbi:hypothetical protein M407DRAFT_87863 [Tulasnella calospora MUT 4182]|uniref:Uncharacterized protein n=1 Tax=Tulasnella calospora MUT 4182 TaxID=1051891 RepID=A0A0C3QN24_9AGAM|nr:hypothetical protein M407DRAFT_87863 [Tulasnella calospora MUT 4182]